MRRKDKLRPNERWLEPTKRQHQKSFWQRAKVIIVGNFTLLKSYDTIVCGVKRKEDGGRTFYRFWDGYSVTTMKHIDAFMEYVKWQNTNSRGKAWWTSSEVYDYSVVCNGILYAEKGDEDINLDNYNVENFLHDYDCTFDLCQYDKKSRNYIFDEIREAISQKKIEDAVCYKSVMIYVQNHPASMFAQRMLAFLESCA